MMTDHDIDDARVYFQELLKCLRKTHEARGQLSNAFCPLNSQTSLGSPSLVEHMDCIVRFDEFNKLLVRLIVERIDYLFGLCLVVNRLEVRLVHYFFEPLSKLRFSLQRFVQFSATLLLKKCNVQAHLFVFMGM